VCVGRISISISHNDVRPRTVTWRFRKWGRGDRLMAEHFKPHFFGKILFYLSKSFKLVFSSFFPSYSLFSTCRRPSITLTSATYYMGSPIPDRTSPSSPPSPEPLRKDSVSSSISLLLNVDEKAGNQNMDTLAKAAFSADSVNDRQHNSSQSHTGHLPTPQSPAVSFPPMMVSRDEGMIRSNTERWSRSSSSSVRDSQSPPSINATVPAITSRPGYGSFPLKSASTDDTNSLSTDKPFVCKECDQTFSRPHNLKSHLATHSTERPYQASKTLNLTKTPLILF
jgi:hypothetical protein